jgi:hypothetical protein
MGMSLSLYDLNQAKAEKVVATILEHGLMSYTDKIKLDGIESNANYYIHPSTHLASIMITDSTHRFVSDIDIANWNAKLNASSYTANDVLVKLLTVDGSNSGIDADLLDGQHASYYQTALGYNPVNKSGDTMTGVLHLPINGLTVGTNQLIVSGGNVGIGITVPTVALDVNGTIDTTGWGMNAPLATITSKGLMSADDKTKLDNLVSGGGGLPSSIPADIITTDTTHRFVTDLDVMNWNAKLDASIYTANDILNKLLTVDGATSNLDADTLDGYHSTYFATTSIATGLLDGLMSSTDKGKLDGIDVNANYYVHPLNHPATIITTDTTHRFVTDTEISGWNAKLDSSSYTANDILNKLLTVDGTTSSLDADTLDGYHYTHFATTDTVTQITNGLMSSTDKTKLDSLVNYVLPSTLPATIIITDTTHRFVTDTETSSWNSKLDASTYTANDVLSKVKTVDGDGSDLDADLLDGYHSTHFATTAVATTSADGLMSSLDKTKLDGLSSTVNATAVSLSTANFNNNLNNTVTDVQILADTVDNLNINKVTNTGGTVVDQYGIDTKYIKNFKNMMQNSQFEIYDNITMIPTRWTTLGVVSNASNFHGTVSLKLTAGQTAQSITGVIDSDWYNTNLVINSRTSFYRRGGSIQVEVYNDTTQLLISTNDPTANSVQSGYSLIFPAHTSWYDSRVSLSFDHTGMHNIMVKFTNVDSIDLYIDAVQLEPDFSGWWPSIYSDGQYSDPNTKITVSTVAPSNPNNFDLWFDIS